MLTTSGARSTSATSDPRRSRFAQSTAISTRPAATSSGSEPRMRSPSGMKWYSRGSGTSPVRYMTASLPSWSSASLVASIDPRASPSGASCVETTNRSCGLIASAAAAGSVVDWGDIVDEPRHANPALDRRIVLEGQARSPFEAELVVEARLQIAVCGLEPFESLVAPALGPQHAHEHTCLTEIGRGLDTRYGDEADARV